ncbi:hypothetical protein JW935_24565 [candidate division KSB1 bacterium]|nr:hypothetical protein [candidate division KSB1 bacterium]
MSLLGIDIGTTGCKAAVFSNDGINLSYAYREYPIIHSAEGKNELNSQLVWDSLCDVISQVVHKAANDRVTALCTSSMGEAATPVSHDRKILGNCILSSDERGSKFIAKISDKYKKAGFYNINPNLLGTNYTYPKLAWLAENEPELFNNTYKFLLWDGLAGYLFGCEPFVSYSIANRTLLFDIHKQDWSDELLNFTKINREKLPVCKPAGAIAGIVSDFMAQSLGLPKGVKVVVGGHDQCCNALGAGLFRAGKAVDGIGTFECITPVYNHIPKAEYMLEQGLNIEHHVVPGLYVSFLYNQGGSLVKWFRDTFAKDCVGGKNIYEKLSAEMPSEPTPLLVLPYFEMSGSPHFLKDASGVIIGLKMNTTRGEILKAIMESVTYYFVESIDSLRKIGIDTSEFIATGGGAKSDRWLQIKADIYGVPFVRNRISECGLVGAAILAGKATGVFASIEQGVEKFVQTERIFEPDKKKNSIYRERCKKYQELFLLMKDYLADF